MLSINLIILRIVSSIIYGCIFLFVTQHQNSLLFFIFILSLMIGSMYEICKINKHSQQFNIITQLIYITISLLILMRIKSLETGSILVFILMILIWASDIGGYIVGKGIGKHKLTKISKNKTWEGVIGSMFFCLIISFIFKSLIESHISIHFILLATIVCISAIIGDLLISKIKRINKMKDSGIFLPGHGGFLDRLDSLFFATPIYYLITWI